MNHAKKIIEDLQKDSKLKSHKVSESYLKLVEFFPLCPLTTKKQHTAALLIAEHLIKALNNGEGDEGLEMYLQALTNHVSDYEKNMFGAPEVSGREMLAYLMELKGFSQTDMAKELGGQSSVSKILKGERELNLGHIRELSKKFEVSPSVFL